MMMATRGAKSAPAKVELIIGDQAARRLEDPTFLRMWADLVAACSWSTACQTWEFAETWYSVYRSTHEPLLVVQEDPIGKLIGLLPLATERASGTITHVGAHQAEYQVWLATNSNCNSFIQNALDALADAYPRGQLSLQYLPPGTPIEWCKPDGEWNRRVLLRAKKRPLLTLGSESSIEASLRKKSNKSRISRLKKLGPLKLSVIDTRSELEAIIDSIAEYCDLRQGAINSSLPFRDDPRKKEFCLRLADRPGISHASALMLGNTVVAANIGLINRTSVTLGIVVHSPFLAEHSPGKILLLLLARELGRQGYTDLDLTPGGDMYKDRSADHYDDVYVLSVPFSRIGYMRSALIAHFRTGVRRTFGKHEHRMKSWIKQISHISMTGLLASALSPFMRRLERHRTHTFAIDPLQVNQVSTGQIFNVNCISDLLCYEPTNMWERGKFQFLLDAAQRLEAGDIVYTLTENGKLLHCAWITQCGTLSSNYDGPFEIPPAACLLWDDYEHPTARSRKLSSLSLAQRLRDATRIPNIKMILAKIKKSDLQSVHTLTRGNLKDYRAFC